MLGGRKSLGSNISTVANRRMPTSPALRVRKVESLLLRQIIPSRLRRVTRSFLSFRELDAQSVMQPPTLTLDAGLWYYFYVNVMGAPWSLLSPSKARRRSRR